MPGLGYDEFMSDHTPSQSSAPAGLRERCRQVRWRLRVQRAAALTVWTGAAGFGCAGLAVLLDRLRWVDTGEPALWIGAACCAVLTAAAVGFGREVTTLQAAQRLDRAGGLYDRLGSAWAFSQLPTATPLQQAAIADAQRFVDAVSPRQAAPWRRPRGLRALVAVLVLTVAGSLVHVEAPAAEAQGLVELGPIALPERPKPALSAADKEKLEAERARLDEEAVRSEDARVGAWISELNELLRALHEGRITPTEAHAGIARLERARAELAKALGDDAEALASHAQKAAQKTKVRANRAASSALQALRAQRWKEAAEALERMAERVNTGELAGRDRKRAAKDLAKLAERLKTERQRSRDRLRKQRDRLKRKQAKQKDRFSRRDRDRLKRTKRQLERLERERQQAGEMRRQLERLQRGLDRSAAEMLRRLAEQQDSMSAGELRKAAEMLRRMSKTAQGRRQMRVATGRLIDLKELLRRAAKRGKRGKVSKGGKGGEGDEMERFLVLARGGESQGAGGEGEGESGPSKGAQKGGEDKDVSVLMPGGKGGGADLVMPGQGQGGQCSAGGGQGDEPGDGVGQGHDPNLLGAKTRSDVETIDHQVAGREGEGSSKSRVVFSAAKKGFTSREWGAVHQDYTAVVEEALDAQSVPAGKRRYVRRYFDLIRPR